MYLLIFRIICNSRLLENVFIPRDTKLNIRFNYKIENIDDTKDSYIQPWFETPLLFTTTKGLFCRRTIHIDDFTVKNKRYKGRDISSFKLKYEIILNNKHILVCKSCKNIKLKCEPNEIALDDEIKSVSVKKDEKIMLSIKNQLAFLNRNRSTRIDHLRLILDEKGQPSIKSEYKDSFCFNFYTKLDTSYRLINLINNDELFDILTDFMIVDYSYVDNNCSSLMLDAYLVDPVEIEAEYFIIGDVESGELIEEDVEVTVNNNQSNGDYSGYTFNYNIIIIISSICLLLICLIVIILYYKRRKQLNECFFDCISFNFS